MYLDRSLLEETAGIFKILMLQTEILVFLMDKNRMPVKGGKK